MKLQIVEGNRQRLDGGAMFGNAPRVLWEKWAPPDEKNRIPLACRALLLQLEDGRNILFEAGVGAFFEPKLKERFGVVEEEHVLLHNLQKLGLSDRDIDIVVLSHLHFDHAGGILSAYGDGPQRLLFPRATFYVGREHYERAQNPGLREKASFIPQIQEALAKSGRLVVVEQGTQPLSSLRVTFRFSHGHTSGLMLAQIHWEERPLVFVSDLIPGVPWMRLPITMGYDRFPELLVEEKRQLLSELAEQNGTLFFTHDPTVAFMKVVPDEKSN